MALATQLSIPLLMLTVLTGLACEKVVDEPVFDLQPSIELLEVSSDTIIEFQQSIDLLIRYEDGDGDIGHPDADQNSLFVKDARLEREDAYYVAPIAPVGSEVSITGTLRLQLDNTFLLGNADVETTVFSLYLVDQAGNQSNTIETPPITILRQ